MFSWFKKKSKDEELENDKFKSLANGLRKREIFLEGEINQELANKIIAQLLFLEGEDIEKDIYLYVNSPGGSVYDGLGIFDAIQHVKPDVHTICDGFTSGMATFILCAGKKGERKCFDNSKISLCSLTKNGTVIDESNLSDQNEEIKYLTNVIQNKFSEMTGQNVERIKEDSKYWSDYHNHYLSPLEAKAYGVIDQIIKR